MTATAIQGVILSTLGSWGSAVFVILTAVIGIGLAYLVFRFGWRKVKTSVGSQYKDVEGSSSPYEFNKRMGYNRRQKSMYRTNKNYDDFEMVSLR